MLAENLIKLLSFERIPENEILSDLITHLCKMLESGSSCLPLSQSEYSIDECLSALKCDGNKSPVGSPGQTKPLILTEQKNLYFQRYFLYESEIAEAIKQRLRQKKSILCDQLSQHLKEIFSEVEGNEQSEAAKKALEHNFFILSGGPGTGKTTTVVKILRLFYLSGIISAPEDVLLLAPTGKAADRLKQSIRTGLILNELSPHQFPTETSTIHRALGYKHDSIHFKHDQSNPLEAKLVIIDEASMIDLPLMAKLLRAIPLETRILLLGDKNQLTSVEVGSVLSDFIKASESASSPLFNGVAILNKSYRNIGDIHRLCESVKAGDSVKSIDIISQSSHRKEGGVLHQELPNDLYSALEPLVKKYWLPALTDSTMEPDKKMAKIGEFRILCPSHHGRFGINEVNRIVEQVLLRSGIQISDQWYEGRNIIVQENDYQLGVFNGDTGLCIKKEGESLVAFSSIEGLQLFPPILLPEVKTSWGLSIHRTQGSEYQHVLIILPPGDENPALSSRELLYTAVSRARKSVSIWAEHNSITTSITQPVQRASGLSTMV